MRVVTGPHGSALHRDGRGTRRQLHVEQHRQIPRGDVVDLIVQPHLAPIFLSLDELRRLLRSWIQQVADQPTGRLRVGDEVGAGRQRARSELHRLVGAAHLDPLRREIPGQPIGTRRILTRDEDVFADGSLLAFADGRAAELEIVAQEPLAVARGGHRGRDRRVEMVHDAVAIGQRLAVAPRKGQPAGRGLLIRHADRPLHGRPRIAVAGVEGVVHLADVVGPASLVEPRGVGPAKEVPRCRLALRVVRVERFGGRREVVGVVTALLVEVHGDLRLVLKRNCNPASRFGLRLCKPVAVHIEQVVIRTAARPRLVMFSAVWRRVGSGGPALHVLKDEPGSTVGVLHRVDQDERVALYGVDALVALRRQQVIRLHQRRICRRDLVAVHAMNEPHDDRELAHEPICVAAREGSRIGEALHLGLHLFELRDAIGAADYEQPERPALPCAGVYSISRVRAGAAFCSACRYCAICSGVVIAVPGS